MKNITIYSEGANSVYFTPTGSNLKIGKQGGYIYFGEEPMLDVEDSEDDSNVKPEDSGDRNQGVSGKPSGGGGGGGGGGFNISLGGKGNPSVMMTSFASGLDSVPFDGFLASLHEGESILTAEEARVWRSMKYGPNLSNQFDYGAMGSAIGANMPNFNGMQVVWNGQVLGRVIAQQQANSLRTMERSGWRG